MRKPANDVPAVPKGPYFECFQKRVSDGWIVVNLLTLDGEKKVEAIFLSHDPAWDE